MQDTKLPRSFCNAPHRKRNCRQVGFQEWNPIDNQDKFGRLAMKLAYKRSMILMIGLFFFSIHPLHLRAQPIEPTRTLNGSVEEMGELSVSSEPPGLHVTLDGIIIGETPLIERKVEPGSHGLRVEDVDTEILVEPGKSVRLSFYKGAFIEIAREKEEPERTQPAKDERVFKETKPVTQARDKEVYNPPSPTYWPQNPNGPIY